MIRGGGMAALVDQLRPDAPRGEHPAITSINASASRIQTRMTLVLTTRDKPPLSGTRTRER
jgi:hypothetical protein